MRHQKLKDYLNSLNPETVVAIGAKNGSGFVYFGPAGDGLLVRRDFQAYYESCKDKIEGRQHNIYTMMTNPMRFDPDTPVKEKKILALNRAESVYLIMASIRIMESYIKNYSDPLERPVLDTCTKFVDKCEAVIIEGEERGGYWFRSEYESGQYFDCREGEDV